MDLDEQIEIKEDELKEFAEWVKCDYVLTSAWRIEGSKKLSRNWSGLFRKMSSQPLLEVVTRVVVAPLLLTREEIS
jgi:hypothetical protein